MKKLITLLMAMGAAVFANSADAQTPHYEWVSTKHVIDPANQTFHGTYCIASDRQGNVYEYAGAADTMSLANGSLVHDVAVSGNYEHFLCKYNKDGDLLWLKKMETLSYYYTAATDSMGNLFMAGHFSGTLDIDPGVGTVNITSTGSGPDAMIVKFDSAGNYLAHTVIPGPASVQTRVLTVDYQGNVVTSGVFPGGYYMAKYDNSLSTNLWNDSYQLGGAITSVSCAPNGDMYVAGEVNGGSFIVFGSVGTVQNMVSNVSLFKGKINAAGVEQWGQLVSAGNVDFTQAQVVATGNGVFFSGHLPNPPFTETINFDNLGSTAGEVDVTGATQYIVEYNEAGEFQNVMSLPGYGYANHLRGDIFGNVFASALFFGQNVDVDPGTGTFNISSHNIQPVLFLIKLDSTFALAGAGALGYYTGANDNKMTVNAFGDIYHAGTFQSTTDFDFSSGVANSTATSLYDGFLLKTSLCSVSGGFNTNVNVNNGTATAAQAGAIYQWLDCDNNNAPIAGATSQSYTPTVAGNYAVDINISGCHDTSACNNVIPVSVKSVSSMGNAVVYPNPATDIVTVENAEKGTLITLTDVTGKVLYSATITDAKHNIQTSAFTPGLYILTAKTSNATYASKVLIK